MEVGYSELVTAFAHRLFRERRWFFRNMLHTPIQSKSLPVVVPRLGWYPFKVELNRFTDLPLAKHLTIVSLLFQREQANGSLSACPLNA